MISRTNGSSLEGTRRNILIVAAICVVVVCYAVFAKYDGGWPSSTTAQGHNVQHVCAPCVSHTEVVKQDCPALNSGVQAELPSPTHAIPNAQLPSVEPSHASSATPVPVVKADLQMLNPAVKQDFQFRNNGLIVPMHVGGFSAEGRLLIPADTTDIFIEIGSNNRNVMQDELPLSNYPTGFLLTFEPLLDKFAYLLTRYGSDKDTQQPLGFQHKRGMAFPFAVHESEKIQTFRVSKVDGCSSLMKPNSKFKDEVRGDQWWPNINEVCVNSMEERQVPTVSLKTVIRDWLGGRQITKMKVDAQGYDLGAFMTAGEYANRVAEVSFETVGDACPTLYEGQPKCTAVVAEMAKLGFKVALLDGRGPPPPGQECVEHVFRGYSANGCEVDFTFVRA